MADTDPSMTERDEAFRESMRRRQDPQAQAWVAKDNAALDLQDQVGRDASEVERRGSAVDDAYRAMHDAREERDNYRADHPRPGPMSGERKAWDQEYGQLDQHASELQQDWQQALQAAPPEELQAMRDRIEQDRQQLQQTIAERQGIALLPSEAAAQEDLHAQVSSAGMANMAARREQREQGQGEGEGRGEGRGQGGGMRLRPNYGAYATSAEEHEQNKQLEEDQRTLAHRYGRTATDVEVQAHERERAERQQQAQTPGQEPGADEQRPAQGQAEPSTAAAQQEQPPQLQEDLHTQVAGMATPESILERRAKRAEQVRGTSTFAEREQAAQAAAAQAAPAQSAAAPAQERKREDGQSSGMGM